MRTFLVLICSLALACAVGGAQEENKSKEPAPKKKQAQSTQYGATPDSGRQYQYHPTIIRQYPVATQAGQTLSDGAQRTKQKTKGSQKVAAPSGHRAAVVQPSSVAQKSADHSASQGQGKLDGARFYGGRFIFRQGKGTTAQGSQQVTTAGASSSKTGRGGYWVGGATKAKTKPTGRSADGTWVRVSVPGPASSKPSPCNLTTNAKQSKPSGAAQARKPAGTPKHREHREEWIKIDGKLMPAGKAGTAGVTAGKGEKVSPTPRPQ